MSENDNKNNDELDDDLDLGSAETDDFDPFATDDDLGGELEKEPSAGIKKDKVSKPAESKEESTASQQNIYEKLPVFEYAGATENIDDTAKTFEELRIEKSVDFPELEDGKRVSWTVEYGKITKPVSDPKAASIGKMKSDIETSKEFLESLKKAKDKNPVCKIKPRVTAQSKGTVSPYKGVFVNVDDAVASGKVISIVPARDGNVYEIRNTEMGNFITPVGDCELLSEVRAGFVPALPQIPNTMLLDIISFFRSYTQNGFEKEVLVNIYWDKTLQKHIAHPPKQTVSKVSIESEMPEQFSTDRYIHYMDVHSHNNMKAFFSSVDNADEKATRIYVVIGRLDRYFPDVKVRISNGGKFLEIPADLVFEQIYDNFYPADWKKSVQFCDSYSVIGDRAGGVE